MYGPDVRVGARVSVHHLGLGFRVQSEGDVVYGPGDRVRARVRIRINI